jgi:hypothetical protein
LTGRLEISGWTPAGVSFTESIFVDRPGSHQVGDYVTESSAGYENSVGGVQPSFLGKESENDVLSGAYSLKTTKTGPHTLIMTWQIPCPSGHGQDTVTFTNDRVQ